MCGQLCIEIKNSFIHISDGIKQEALYRSRAVSEYTGICKAREMKLRDSSSVYSASTAEDEQDLWTTSSEAVHEETRTTIMMRDIPNSYSSSELTELFDAAGFQGTYDFVYLPIDFRTSMSLGYAFVNFVNSWVAQQFMMYFDGFSSWQFASAKVCRAFWSDPNQGLEEHIERYRNSPVMHENVPDNFKPRLFQNGVRVAFPEPTKRIKLPRVRPAKTHR